MNKTITSIKETISTNQFFFITYLLLTLCATIILMSTNKGDAILFFDDWRTIPLSNKIFRFITTLAEEPSYIILTIIFFLFLGKKRSLSIPIMGIVVTIVSFISKELFHHPRPYIWFQKRNQLDLLTLVPEEKILVAYTSFPSGHTMSAFAICTISALYLPYKKITGPILCLVAYGIGISRIYLTHHFLIDITIGGFIGVVIAILFHTLLRVNGHNKKSSNMTY